jgi:hypothetical protein
MKTQSSFGHHANPALCRKLRVQKMGATKDGGGKQMKRRRTFATATCEIHGVEVKGKNGKEVRCSIPATKGERFNGCPKCPSLRHDNCGYSI